jgi:hypothetical protein
LYNFSTAIQGFLLWGGWGFFINSKVSFMNGITSGLVQGVFSFIATLIVIGVLTKLFNFFDRALFKFIIPTLVMITALTFFSVVAHTLAGTPQILKTIAPNLTVSALFCAFTTYKLINAKDH